MSINHKWSQEDCEIAFCMALLDVSTVDQRLKRFSEIRGISESAILGKIVNYKRLLSGEEAPKKDTEYYANKFKNLSMDDCHNTLAKFFYSNLDVKNEVKKATSRSTKKKQESAGFYEVAFEMFKNNELEECREVLVGHVHPDNTNPNVWNLFGMVCGRLGDHLKAYGHFKKGFLLDASHKPCFFNYLVSCVALSYTKEYFDTVLRVIGHLEDNERETLISNFYEGIENGAISLFEVPEEFYPYAMFGHEPALVILNLRDQFLPLSMKIIPRMACKVMKVNTAPIAQWLMAMGILYKTNVSNMGHPKARELYAQAIYHSGLFDGGEEEMVEYFKTERPIAMNCYLYDFYVARIQNLKKSNAA